MKKTHIYISLAVIVGGALVAIPVFAATQSTTGMGHFFSFNHNSTIARPTLVGVVTAVSGTALVVSLQPMMPMRKLATSTVAVRPTTYTVDASNATVSRGFGTSTAAVALSSIAVNDHIAVFGTVSGASVAATKIIDVPPMPAGSKPFTSPKKGFKKPTGALSSRVAIGSVTAINGSQFTISSRMFRKSASSTPATVETIVTTDATSFKENGTVASLSNLAIGNTVMAVGTSTAPNTLTAGTVRIMLPRQKTTTQ
jgi:hypothetical protein